MNQGRAQEGKPPIVWAEPELLEDEGPIMVDHDFKEMDVLNALLPREAAKIAVEYVAILAGQQVALDARLDAFRACALGGDEVEYVVRDYVGDRFLYLPRIRHIDKLGDLGDEVAPYEAQAAIVQDANGNPTLPANTATLTWPFHRLHVWRDALGGRFEVTLFSVLGVKLPLPAELAIPWGHFDKWDLYGKKRHQGTRRGGPLRLI